MLLKYVLMRRREENDRSAVALVTGNVKYKRRTLSISLNMPLTKLLSFSASAMVLAFVTFLTLTEVPAKAVLIAPASIDNCTFKRETSIFPLKRQRIFHIWPYHWQH